MTKPIKPVRRKGAVKKVIRRIAMPHDALEPDITLTVTGLPVPVANPLSDLSAASFTAQILGQPGQKRGLRGGDETLNLARSTYMDTEWSGRADRRLKRGRMTKTRV
jgi:hypothetical protein